MPPGASNFKMFWWFLSLADMFIHHATKNHVAPAQEIVREMVTLQVEEPGLEPCRCLCYSASLESEVM